jgi:hypothetical protein
MNSLFGWLVADGWCWFVLREEYCWLVASGWFVVREKYCWLVADKPNEQAACTRFVFRAPMGSPFVMLERRTQLASAANCSSRHRQTPLAARSRPTWLKIV